MAEPPAKKSKKQIKSRYWWVEANPKLDVDPAIPAIRPPEFDEVGMHYMKWVQHTAGQVHYHAVLHFKESITMNMVKNYWGCPWIHCEPLRDNSSADAYMTSHDVTEGPVEFGVNNMRQGYRSDLMTAFAMIKEGRTPAEARMFNPNLYRYVKGVDKMAIDLKEKKPYEGDRTVVVLWGPADVGKNTRIYGRYGRENCYVINLNDQHPFDEYEWQENLVIDDLKPAYQSIDAVKNLIATDIRHVQCRYENRAASWGRVIINSNFDPQSWWPMAQDRDKVLKRIDHVEHIVSMDSPSELFPPVNPNKRKLPVYFVFLKAM